MTQPIFFRMQMEIVRNPDKTYSREVLQLCWHRAIVDEFGEPVPPFVENGFTDIILSEHPELQTLVESATSLAVPIAVQKINNPSVPNSSNP